MVSSNRLRKATLRRFQACILPLHPKCKVVSINHLLSSTLTFAHHTALSSFLVKGYLSLLSLLALHMVHHFHLVLESSAHLVCRPPMT